MKGHKLYVKSPYDYELFNELYVNKIKNNTHRFVNGLVNYGRFYPMVLKIRK
jgi:hypothetical protein